VPLPGVGEDSEEVGEFGRLESHGTINAATVAENKPHYIYRVSQRCQCWRGGNQQDSQRQGADLHLRSKFRTSSHHVPLRSVGTRTRVGLKGRKNRRVVGKFDLGQVEEDSDRLLQLES
jgi:hypothetical protein